MLVRSLLMLMRLTQGKTILKRGQRFAQLRKILRVLSLHSTPNRRQRLEARSKTSRKDECRECRARCPRRRHAPGLNTMSEPLNPCCSRC